MKKGVSNKFLYLSAVADMALLSAQTETPARVVCLTMICCLPLWMFIGYIVQKVELGASWGLNLIWGIYAGYSCLQLREILLLIWDFNLAADLFPAVFWLGMVCVNSENHGELSRFAGLMMGLFALGSFLFIISIFPCVHTEYLVLEVDSDVWNALSVRLAAILLPMPEILVYFNKQESVKLFNFMGIFASIGFSFAAISFLAEGIFGSSKKTLFDSALLGQLLSVERVETLLIILWVLLFFTRFRLICSEVRNNSGKSSDARKIVFPLAVLLLYAIMVLWGAPVIKMKWLVSAAVWLVLIYAAVKGVICRGTACSE